MLRGALVLAGTALPPIARAATAAVPARALPAEVLRGLPADVAPVLSPARWVGGGHLTVFGFEAYDAALWAVAGFRAAEFMASPFVLELTYLRSFKAGAIAERSLREMARFTSLSTERSQAWQTGLQAALPDVRPGDRIAGCTLPGRGVIFVANGAPRGEVGDPEFARLFFSIWLAGGTSEPELRERLLGRLTS